MTTETEPKPKTIFITGYGPFRNYSVNPSSKAVELLQEKLTTLAKLKHPKYQENNYKFIINPNVPVSYYDVDNLAYPIDCEYIINCGVSYKNERKIRIEKCANTMGYRKKDINGKTREDAEYLLTHEKKIKNHCYTTKIDVEKIVEKVNNQNRFRQVKEGSQDEAQDVCDSSTDAGRYLCEYILCKSLQYQEKSVFVHVSEFSKVPLKETAELLFQIVDAILP